MNLCIRTFISRESSHLICCRRLTTQRTRRKFRSSLLTGKFRSSTSHSNKSRPFGYINENNIILGVVFINGTVFLTWKLSYANLRSNHDERLLWFMTKNFSMFSKNYKSISI